MNVQRRQAFEGEALVVDVRHSGPGLYQRGRDKFGQLRKASLASPITGTQNLIMPNHPNALTSADSAWRGDLWRLSPGAPRRAAWVACWLSEAVNWIIHSPGRW